jgi:dihydrofolate reductase
MSAANTSRGTVGAAIGRRRRRTIAPCRRYYRIDESIDAIDALPAEHAYVLGGATIYELFQPAVSEMVLGRIPGEYAGDAHFPDWDRDAWTRRERIDYDDVTLERWVRVD